MFKNISKIKLITKLSLEDSMEFNNKNTQFNSGATLFLSLICAVLLSCSMTVGYFSYMSGAEGVEEFWLILPYHVICIVLSVVVFVITLFIRKNGVVQSFISDTMGVTQMCLIIALCIISSHVETPVIGIKNISAIIIFMFAIGVFMRFDIKVTLVLEALMVVCFGASLVLQKDIISNFYPSLMNLISAFVLAAFAAAICWESRKRNFVATKELERLASLDHLTRLHNRRSFDVYIEREWERATKKNLVMSLLFIDVDHFKRYNDLHGHPEGDACLYTVADVISGSARKSDFVARYGGEEFVVSITGGGGEIAERIAHEIQGNMEKRNIPHGDSVVPYVTLSIGCMICRPGDPDAITLDEFIQMADDALYSAKEEGRNQIVFHPKAIRNV